MKYKNVIITLFAAVGFLSASSVPISASKTVSKSMRGTWYFYASPKMHNMNIYTFSKHGIRRGYETETKQSRGSFSPLMHRGFSKMSIRGHHARKYQYFTFDIDYAYIPYKMKIAGKYQHVILATQEQGRGLAVYTKFMPAKKYTVTFHNYN